MINSGKIKITNDGKIIMQFRNYHHVIDSDTELYYKQQVDKVIAELKAENKRLKASPEEIMKEVFDKALIYQHDMVRLEDAYRLAVSLRKAKRALLIARAERNKALAAIVHCQGAWYDILDAKQSGKFWNKGSKLLNASQKCRAKAEEYK